MNKSVEEIAQEKVESAVRDILTMNGEDVSREGLLETPARVARMYKELMKGLGEDPNVHLEKQFTSDNDQMVVIRDIPFFSMCEHHLVPFHGTAHVGYIPGGENGQYRVAGLSKFARVLEGYARRPQIQESLTAQISNAINNVLKPQGVIVVIKAEHMCMSMRGIQKQGSSTVTSSVHGLFATNQDGCKDEFFEALKL